MEVFCTIITPTYIPIAKVLYSSLQKFHPEAKLQVFIAGEFSLNGDSGFTIVEEADLTTSVFFSGLKQKYEHTNEDLFRWALKPVLIGHLLESGYTKVIFIDTDTYFVSPTDFIFNLLDKYDIVITPHWPDPDIITNPESTLAVMKGGLFNAGFIAAGKNGLPAITWWAGMCHYKMEKNSMLGIFDDQKYLDLFPILFDGVHILKHRGCNLASWNIQSSKRELVNGRLLINREFEPVFIHFAKDTIVNILNKNDVLLKPYLNEYAQLLSDNGFDLFKNQDNFSPAKYETAFYGLKHKIRLRTRIKRFLFKLAEKL